MRAFVFSESQIEPVLQRWFGTQQMSTDDELAFTARVNAFLMSDAAAELRMPQHDPKDAGTDAIAQKEQDNE